MARKELTVSELAAKGGKARALSLSPERRSEIARNAVAVRHGSKIPKATHEGVLTIGDMEIPCAVLEGGRRVLTQSGFMIALGRARQAKGRQYYDGDVNLPAFLTAKNLKPFIPEDLYVTSSQIEFTTLSGTVAFGYSAELLPKVCGVFLDADSAGVLVHNQLPIASKALLLIRGLAHVGIVALVDEATGYQYDRPRRDLEEYLKTFLSDSLRRWVRTFPADYFKHLCKLRGVELRHDMKLPQYFGHLTNNLIYRRIAPGLLKQLQERRSERGTSSNKLHSWLSTDVGVPEVLIHLGTVVGLMKVHTNLMDRGEYKTPEEAYAAFEKQLDQIAYIYPEAPGLFDDPKDWIPR
jgi:hypothetical protein